MQPETPVWFGLLGPLRVRHDGVEMTVPPRLRVLLAALLVRAGQPVSVSELAYMVWGAQAPAAATVTLRSYVKRLRQALGPVTGARIITRSTGYAIEVGRDELDLLQFRSLFLAGRAALRESTWQRASDALTAALALWRGEPLTDIASEPLRNSEVPALEQLRLQALEWRIEADIQLGHTGTLAPELHDLAARYPLRERFHAQRMLVLYRCGRQAEAFAAYRQARQVLRDELGVEPGADLQELHRRVLAGDLEIAPHTAPGPLMPPKQLLAAVRFFTGRADELRRLAELLESAGKPEGTVIISAIDGTPGVGKTALALHWAHQVADRFPEGQIYVNLRGFDPSSAPLTPAQAIRRLLDALGVPADRIPADLDAQASLYRSQLAGRRLLVVLDNARDADQVSMLLPASPGCLTLVTSRSQLAGLAVDFGANVITLDVLTEADASELLARCLGANRVRHEPAAAAEIVRLCAALPLALSIAAARAAAKPQFPLAALVAELTATRNRLNALDAGSATTSMRTVFSWSYRQLSGSAARMFRLLGTHPGPDITVTAAASLAGVSQQDSRAMLTELTRTNLLTEHVPGRYTFHDLLRSYAVEEAQDSGSDNDRADAAGRALDYYLYSSYKAALQLQPTREPLALTPMRAGVVPETPEAYEAALEWFDREHLVLIEMVTLASRMGFATQVWQLAWTLITFLDRRSHWHDLAATQHVALAAAERAGDALGQAHARRALGRAYSRLRFPQVARRHLRLALRRFRQVGDYAGDARASIDLAQAAELRGNYGQAFGYSRRALELFQAISNRGGQADALNAVGWFLAHLGDYQPALVSCDQAMALHRDLSDRPGQAATWDSLGYIHLQLGHPEEAVTCYQHAYDMLVGLGDRYNQATVLTCLGDSQLAAGRPSAADDAWRQALRILIELQHPSAALLRTKLRLHDPDR